MGRVEPPQQRDVQLFAGDDEPGRAVDPVAEFGVGCGGAGAAGACARAAPPGSGSAARTAGEASAHAAASAIVLPAIDPTDARRPLAQLCDANKVSLAYSLIRVRLALPRWKGQREFRGSGLRLAHCRRRRQGFQFVSDRTTPDAAMLETRCGLICWRLPDTALFVRARRRRNRRQPRKAGFAATISVTA